MRKVILTTVGSLGDLHPFIALALGLQARGFHPVMAVPADHVAKCRAAGLEAVAVLPGFDAICARMGIAQGDAVARLMADQRHLLEQAVLPSLPSSADELDAIVAGAEAIIASVFVIAAPIIAEKHGLPMVAVLLQPMAMASVYDPPHTPDFRIMKHPPVGWLAAQWNRLLYGAVRSFIQLHYGPRINRVRRAHGLPHRSARLMLESGRTAPLTLCCYAPEFGPLPPDAPPQALVVGFPVFDSESGAAAQLPAEVEAFLDAGPPPLIFTLGSFAVHAAGNFYAEAMAAARRLGQRAILLTGGPLAIDGGEDVLCVPYAPHSLLFPRASAIIHHGGAGTTGQALRAGKPQIVVPHMGDQFDNGWRIERMGVGRNLPASRFSAARVVPMLAALMADAPARAEAQRVAALIAAADPAAAAAIAIEAELDRRRLAVD